MSLVRRLAARFPQQVSQVKLLGKIASYYRARMRRGKSTWLDYDAEMTSQSPVNDLPVCFAARVVLERGYTSLIEIGTHTGHRACALKRLFPAMNVYGLDIQKQFETPMEFEGVQFRLFDLDFIRQPRPRSVIFSVWTLGCMTSGQLDTFLDASQAGGHDVIFREVTPAFAHSGSMPRNERTWYHDYDGIFARHGYRMLGPRHIGQIAQFDFESFDLGYLNAAVRQ